MSADQGIGLQVGFLSSEPGCGVNKGFFQHMHGLARGKSLDRKSKSRDLNLCALHLWEPLFISLKGERLDLVFAFYKLYKPKDSI